ncbi:hypothetical protein [Lactobacillus johnsonii]|jgi:vacuolar-type H+-ATPase subunit E/Vma4|uniref:Uncharacterized protein n=1 Tax=Lactobacillus johnsonii TaxID=33959 RepID=A0A9X7T7T3_LACJH|nr:hypothetical protein [Lactobacillus johnsonii]QIA88611.1 hypothetical protein FEE39_10220 [Lactobacillus johnsonii]
MYKDKEAQRKYHREYQRNRRKKLRKKANAGDKEAQNKLENEREVSRNSMKKSRASTKLKAKNGDNEAIFKQKKESLDGLFRSAKSFINTNATKEQLIILKELIKAKLNQKEGS